ncbi:hypothetical protein F5888DRAFT_1732963, partial [Russula emetica]
MMSTRLTVVPSQCQQHGPVPLRTSSSSISVSVLCLIHASSALVLATETQYDLTATERAARTHPDAPP